MFGESQLRSGHLVSGVLLALLAFVLLLLYPNLPLDLIEALTYGREWQLGYDKLPPLPWWLVVIHVSLAATIWTLTVAVAYSLQRPAAPLVASDRG